MKKLISFWKQVRDKSSDMFTLFRVGIGVKVPTHKFHLKDKTDPLKIEGLQNDATDPDKYLSIDSSNIVKYRTGAQVLTDIGGTPLTTEEVQDIAGALVATGGTKTGIAVTYQDATGDVDFVVDHDAATNYVAAEHVDWAGSSTGTVHSSNIPTLNQNTTGTAAGLSATLVVGSGGTGATSLTDNAVLTGAGTSAVTAESNLSFTGSTLTVNHTVMGPADADLNIVSDDDIIFTVDSDGDGTPGAIFRDRTAELARIDMEPGAATIHVGPDDNSVANIRRKTHSDDDGGPLSIRGGSATGTNKAGGYLNLEGGIGTGNGVGGGIRFWQSPAGSSGSAANSLVEIASLIGGDLQIDGDLAVDGGSIRNSLSASNFTISSSRVLSLRHDGAYNIELGNSTNTSVLTVAGDSEVVTINGTLELGHINDTTLARVSAGVVSIEGNTIATTNKLIDTKVAAYWSSSTGGFYVPLSGATFTENTSLSTSSYALMYVVPYDGKILRISSFHQNAPSGDTTFEVYIDGDDDDLTNDQRGSDMTTSTYTRGFTEDCPTDWTFSRGEAIAIKRTDSVARYGVTMTVVFEFDTTT